MKEYRKYQGLYDPAYEHDACGVGIVANLNGQKTYDIIRNAIRVLINLEHRGACGCDPDVNGSSRRPSGMKIREFSAGAMFRSTTPRLVGSLMMYLH